MTWRKLCSYSSRFWDFYQIFCVKVCSFLIKVLLYGIILPIWWPIPHVSDPHTTGGKQTQSPFHANRNKQSITKRETQQLCTLTACHSISSHHQTIKPIISFSKNISLCCSQHEKQNSITSLRKRRPCWANAVNGILLSIKETFVALETKFRHRWARLSYLITQWSIHLKIIILVDWLIAWSVRGSETVPPPPSGPGQTLKISGLWNVG